MEIGDRDIVKKIKLFQEIPEGELDELLEKLENRRYRVGSVIFHEGDVGSEFYILLSGKVQVQMEEEGKAHVLAELGAGDSFGEMALVELSKRSATIRVLEECLVSVLTVEAFQELHRLDVELYARILFNLARETTRRLHQMDHKFVKVMKFLF